MPQRVLVVLTGFCFFLGLLLCSLVWKLILYEQRQMLVTQTQNECSAELQRVNGCHKQMNDTFPIERVKAKVLPV